MTNLLKDIYEKISWNEIDPKIEPLVKALNLRYQTNMSCEGHSDNPIFKEPYVDLVNNSNFDDLNECLQNYNHEKRIEWMLLPLPPYGARLMPDYKGHKLMDECERETDPIKKEELEERVLEKILINDHPSLHELQDSANDLARYLKQIWT